MLIILLLFWCESICGTAMRDAATADGELQSCDRAWSPALAQSPGLWLPAGISPRIESRAAVWPTLGGGNGPIGASVCGGGHGRAWRGHLGSSQHREGRPRRRETATPWRNRNRPPQ